MSDAPKDPPKFYMPSRFEFFVAQAMQTVQAADYEDLDDPHTSMATDILDIAESVMEAIERRLELEPLPGEER